MTKKNEIHPELDTTKSAEYMFNQMTEIESNEDVVEEVDIVLTEDELNEPEDIVEEPEEEQATETTEEETEDVREEVSEQEENTEEPKEEKGMWVRDNGEDVFIKEEDMPKYIQLGRQHNRVMQENSAELRLVKLMKTDPSLADKFNQMLNEKYNTKKEKEPETEEDMIVDKKDVLNVVNPKITEIERKMARIEHARAESDFENYSERLLNGFNSEEREELGKLAGQEIAKLKQYDPKIGDRLEFDLTARKKFMYNIVNEYQSTKKNGQSAPLDKISKGEKPAKKLLKPTSRSQAPADSGQNMTEKIAKMERSEFKKFLKTVGNNPNLIKKE